MRIEFDEGYVEMIRSKSPGKIYLTIGVIDPNNSLVKNTNCAEVTEQQLLEMVRDVIPVKKGQ